LEKVKQSNGGGARINLKGVQNHKTERNK